MNKWTVLVNYGEYACGLFETEEEAKKEIGRLMKCDSEKNYNTLLIINAD